MIEGYELSTRHLVKYPDCNATSNLFGGQMLSWFDESAAIFAGGIMRTNRIVTKHFGNMSFDIPTERGKVVSIYCKVVKEGTTSLTVHAIATKKDFGDIEEVQVADTEIVFVAINPEGCSTPWKYKTEV
jgi:acyl-CoA hydrolase